MTQLNKEINETFNIAVYLQLMSSFTQYYDFDEIQKMVSEIHSFIKTSTEEEISIKLDYIKTGLNKMAEPFILKFPPKKSINDIAFDWNEFFKNKYEIYSYGLEYGWLEERMDLRNWKLYNYVPYHFKIGLYAHKGNFGIEEEFLIKDSFNILVKAKKYYEKLIEYGDIKQKILKNENKNNFDYDTTAKITDLKYEISANSRLTIISFYAFIECFVNSTGFSYAKRNQKKISEEDFEILNGKKNGRYLQLKSKIERFQKILREDKIAIHITSDENQIEEPFQSFFNTYEQIRNSSVHFSPNKEQIWLRPKVWLDKAEEFSQISMQVARFFWKACYPDLSEPDYIGRLNYETFISKSQSYLQNIEDVENELKAK